MNKINPHPANAGFSFSLPENWCIFFKRIKAKIFMPYREGFALVGAWLIEHERTLAQYPAEGNRARILAERRCVGGDIFDLARRLRAGAADLPLYAIGCVGEDDDGHAVLSGCHQLEIDTYQLQTIAGVATAHAEIIISNAWGSRTSICYAGANAALGLENFDFRHCLARWFHLGDVYLLGQLAQCEEKPGTITGRVLQAARAAGLTTSLSMPAPAEGYYEEDCLKVLAQADYLILEAPKGLAGPRRPPDRDSNFRQEKWENTARDLLAQGVSSGVGIYSAEKGLSVFRGRESRWHDFAVSGSPSNAVPSPSESSAAGFLAKFLYERYNDHDS